MQLKTCHHCRKPASYIWRMGTVKPLCSRHFQYMLDSFFGHGSTHKTYRQVLFPHDVKRMREEYSQLTRRSDKTAYLQKQAETYGIQQDSIWKAIHGKTWKWL